MWNKCVALVVAVVLIGACAPRVSAQAQVSGLIVSDTAAGTENRTDFALDTTTIYAIFDYAGADRTYISVSLEGLGLYDIVVKRAQYSGSGKATVAIKGADVYLSMTNDLHSSALEAQTRAKKAANQEVGQRQYLQDVLSMAGHMRTAVRVLKTLKLDDVRAGQLADLGGAVDTLERLGEEAMALKPDQPKEMKAKGDEMKSPAEDAVRLAKVLKDGAASVGEIALPPSGDQDYTLQVSVSDQPADSKEFRVTESGSNSAAVGTPTRTPSSRGTAVPVRVTATAPAGETGRATATRAGASVVPATAPAGSTAAGARLGAAATGAPAGPIAPAAPTISGAGAEATPPGGDNAATLPLGATLAAGAAGEAVATWTVPALAGGSADSSSPPSGRAVGRNATDGTRDTRGPNLAVIALGAVALAGLALWLRRRA